MARPSSLCSLLMLLVAPAAWGQPPAATGPRIHDALPAGFQPDGKLDEWKGPPSLTLGAEQQVAGGSKVTSPQDVSAKVWLALGPEGLAVAGEVQDDRVQLAVKPKELHKDHVELWLALPQPKLPPIAFTNQSGEHELATAQACDGNPAIRLGEPAECRAWWKKQGAYRKTLQRPFSAQYQVLSKGIVRVGQKGPPLTSVRYEPMPGGYRFEALIPASALPRSAQAPLRDVKVIVDLMDGDGGKGKPAETVLSSSSGKLVGERTYQAVTLATPVRFGAWPDLLERAMKAHESASYQPAPDAAKLSVWLNPAIGNQYAPELPSPQVRELDLSRVEPQGTLGDVEVVTVPGQVDRHGVPSVWTVSRRGKTILDARNGGTRVVRIAPRPPGLLLLHVREQPLSPLGIGVCAECPQLSFQLVKMDAQGRFSEPEQLEGVSSQGGKVEWSATPDLSRIEAFYDGKDGTAKQPAVRYTWNAKAGRYDAEKFPRAP